MLQYYTLTNEDRIQFLSENAGSLLSGNYFFEQVIPFNFMTQVDNRVFEPYIPSNVELVFNEFTEEEKALTRFLFQYLDHFLAVEFVEVDDSSAAIGFGKHNMTVGGYANLPPLNGNNAVFLNISESENNPNDFATAKILPHEIGHALGLKHPFEGNNTLSGGAGVDNTLTTILSYNNVFYEGGSEGNLVEKYVGGFRELDIYALIELYGEQSSPKRDTYVLNDHGDFSQRNFGIDIYWFISVETPFVLIDTGGRDNIDAYNLNFDGVAIFDFDEGLFLSESQRFQTYIFETNTWDSDFDVSGVGIVPMLSLYPSTVIESYSGTTGDDHIFGNDLSQAAAGGGGTNWFFGGGGNDLYRGYHGFDTAAYSGQMSQYSVRLESLDGLDFGFTVIDRRENGDGVDYLLEVEVLQFSGDDFFDIGIRSGAASLSPAAFEAITELYIAYFDRAPASKGLLYWADRLADGMELPQIAESFFVQPEIQTTYAAYLNEDGSLADTEAFVTIVFNNLLGRDPSGPYWVNELNTNPDITPAIFILAVLNGAKAASGSPVDAAYLADKTDIGVYFSAIKGLSDYDDTIAVMDLYDGSDASIANAVAAIDQIYAEALDPNTGEFLLSLVGVIDDPFAIA